MTDIEHRHLRSAVEFAVLMASESQKRKPVMPFPAELKTYFNKARIPTGSLGRLRRAIEADDLFRRRIAAGALPELVDEIGRLWLTRPEGWEATASGLAAAADDVTESSGLEKQLKRAERKRAAAELAAVRTRAELVRLTELVDSQQAELHDLRAEVCKAEDALGETKTELIDVRVEIRHARDREAAAAARAERAETQLAAAAARAERAETQLAPAESHSAPVDTVNHTAEISDAADAARSLAEQLESLLGPAQAHERDDAAARRPSRRVPLALPGGVISTSAEAAAFLVRSDAVLFVDGYNVAKLAWPRRTLEQQRQHLLDAVENLARRFGTDVTVVFDGAAVVGGHAHRRRLVRVVYSADGVTADDVIRDEVRRLPASRAVVVVTNDGEIIRDVRADGANVVPSNAFAAVF